MNRAQIRRFLYPSAALIILCLLGKYLLGMLFPFLLGYLIARSAEPAVGHLSRHLPRGVSSALAVTVTLLLGVGILSLLGAILVRQLSRMAEAMPDLRDTTKSSMLILQDFFIQLSDHSPEGLRPLLVQSVLKFFSNGSALLDHIADKIPDFIGSFLSGLPDKALSLGTGILAAFLISFRLPKLQRLREKVPEKWQQVYLPVARKFRHALACWFLAQGKLALITYGIVTLGLLIMGISYAPIWALAVALVDAVPMLGTGTVLMPWALAELLRSRPGTALGLMGIFLLCSLVRAVLEPRFLGKQLGLDALSTLFFLYVGYWFWGLPGMLLLPLLAGALRSATAQTPPSSY